MARTSGMMAPTMQLTGHGGEVFSMKFSPDGKHVASASFDKQIFLWNVYGECENYAVLKGHRNAVLDVHWSTDSTHVYSASADKTIAIWDAETFKRIKQITQHTSIVNSVHPARRGPELLVSGSDDGTTRVWDARSRNATHEFGSPYQITAVSFSDTAEKVFCGGIDNLIRCFDLRKAGETPEFVLSGHHDTITGISLSPDGSHLLSNAMDNTVRCWDVRPFAPTERCVKIFEGVVHTFEKNLLKCSWSADGSKVAAGSSDRMVYVWDAMTRNVLYKLPGHNGSVNEVAFHPKEPIIGSCSSDRTIYMGEIEP
eukprot:GILJ01004724.1.p1 GENE.GILJ01004724.1~~GILJ01004724.1.p1  ORF type:complete len:366 (+),score=51.77 GILJ01004724.1:162-1100(+)